MKNKIPCKKKEECCGCMACYNICPFSAIEIVNSFEGFMLPKINEKKCVKCGLCYQTCPVINEIHSNDLDLAFAAYAKSQQIRYYSSSGGIFSVIANKIIDLNGVVFGAAFDNSFNVSHVSAGNKDEIIKLRGAKYLQSNIGRIYINVKNELLKNRIVYFIGTPCQIAGLRAYLNKDYNNLICSDLICHGVPSPKIWDKYLNEKISNASNVSFRDKRYGWTNYSLVLNSTQKEIILNGQNNTFMEGFINNYFLRESCYNCKFKGYKRLGDITLADFWGIDKIISDFDENNSGTSLILINSEKGKILFDSIQQEIIYKKVNRKEALKYNLSAIQSSYRPIQRTRFFKNIEKKSYEQNLIEIKKLNLKEKILIRIKKG